MFGGVPLQPEPGLAGTEAPAGVQRLRLSEVLARYLDYRETQHGDRRADSEVAPIIKFAIELLDDPVMRDLKGDDFLKLKKAIPDIPTKLGFAFDESADLYCRWTYVRDHGWQFERDGKQFPFKRTSETTISVGWKIALTSVWQFAIEHRFASGPLPDFEISTLKNPGAVERDAFRNHELLAFLKAPAFGGCAGRARMWVEGKYFYQGFFYWGELIGVFSGMRPGETSQLRCRDIMPLHGRPHIRFALLSVEEEEKARHAAVSGGNDGKTDSAYRWVSLHWILLRLGIVERRDAIVADYVARKVEEAGGRPQLSDEQFAQIEKEAGDLWLFPDWPVYVKKTGEIKWAFALGKACRYAFFKLKMERDGLTQYSARHFFKGLIDEVRGLAERSRKVILGHSTKGEVTNNYGPKLLTEEESLIVHRLSNRHIWRMALVLIRAKRKAERGELKVIEAWRNDTRSGDERFQEALAKRAQLYR